MVNSSGDYDSVICEKTELHRSIGKASSSFMEGISRNVLANVRNYDIGVSKFELYSHYYLTFWWLFVSVLKPNPLLYK